MRNQKYLWSVILPLHLLALITAIMIEFRAVDILLFMVGYICIGGLGVNVGLHRWASHKSIKVNRFAKPIILFFSTVACQGHMIWWTAVHRGYHHCYSDTKRDVHSPIHGSWNAFFGWIIKHDPTTVDLKRSLDLLRDNKVKLFHKHTFTIIWLTWVIAGLISPHVLLFVFLLPAIIGLHSEGLVNLLCHTNNGYRNFETKDNSRNVPLLGLFDWGNGWHNNHHHRPGSFDFGTSVSGKWWEFDPCKLFLPFIRDYAK